MIACENDEARRNILLHHADLVWMDAQRDIGNAADLAAVGHRYATLRRTLAHGVLGAIGAIGV
ncbi:hypothetical protein KVP09_02075 [Alcaligenaceae bacterium CGII-47]|nr:hypothetical protein [Alcaligenaceae bacterium CGII-47]